MFCFRWKGNEPSGIIRVEVHLFSGFELSNVLPSTIDLNYGSRGDRAWFVVANVSLFLTIICFLFIEFGLFIGLVFYLDKFILCCLH